VSVRGVLFLRSLPRRPALSPQRVTVFRIGFGRRLRKPPAALLQRLRAGAYSDVVDIGIAGALDPGLREGDLVLSTLEVPFDSPEPLEPRRRPEICEVTRRLAQGRGVALKQAPVLTHERPVLSRRDRLAWFERTGAAAVQMEHAWAVQLLASLLPAPVFRGLRFTHLVLISDAVPAGEGSLASLRAGARAWAAYVSQRGIRRLRRDFLLQWLTRGGTDETQGL